MNELQLRAGAARLVISPPPGIYLIGYGDRSKGNRGVHDELTATALVLDDGQTQIALVACDLLCLNEFIVDRIRAAVAPIQPILCCSHTHSGPIGYAGEGSKTSERQYIGSLIERVTVAVQQAAQNVAPAHLSLAQAQAEIAVNRREHTADGKVIIGENPSGPVDHGVNVVSIFQDNGGRLATIVNYACHGTVLGPDNLLASADWVGAMRVHLESEIGGLSLFLQGAAGDLNPRMGWGKQQVWQMVEDQGRQVAEATLQAARSEQCLLQSTPLALKRIEAWLPFEEKVTGSEPPKSYRKRILSMAGLPSFLWSLTDILLDRRYPWLSRLQAGEGENQGFWCTPLRINAARIGQLALVTFGCETFTEIGMQVKSASPTPFTLFASVSDGCIGYLPTAQAHAEGGYEVDMAPFAYRFPGRLSVRSPEISQRAAQQMLESLWQDEEIIKAS